MWWIVGAFVGGVVVGAAVVALLWYALDHLGPWAG